MGIIVLINNVTLKFVHDKKILIVYFLLKDDNIILKIIK